MKEIVIEWSHNWPRDWWWRNKFKIPFGSEQHRCITQIDIVFEYMEDQLLGEAILEDDISNSKKERLKKEGYISKTPIDQKKNKSAFDKINLDVINGRKES